LRIGVETLRQWMIAEEPGSTDPAAGLARKEESVENVLALESNRR
jgi:hypothetical protein